MGIDTQIQHEEEGEAVRENDGEGAVTRVESKNEL